MVMSTAKSIAKGDGAPRLGHDELDVFGSLGESRRRRQAGEATHEKGRNYLERAIRDHMTSMTAAAPSVHTTVVMCISASRTADR